jgi:hypothetical protein
VLARDLIDKLSRVGAIQKKRGELEGAGWELTFTMSFATYLVWSVGTSSSRSSCLEGWREVLNGFDPYLASLSAEEITALILLLDYYLNHGEAAIASK